MSDKKNIDRLFQEKFKEFEISPDKSVWDKIEAELDSNIKREKRVLPIWWKLGGVAAILALLIAIGYNTLKEDTINNTITETNAEPNHTEGKEIINNTDLLNNKKSEINTVVKNSQELESNIHNKNSEVPKNSTNTDNIDRGSSNKIVTASKTKNHEEIKKNLNPVKNNNENNTAITNSNTNKDDKNSTQKVNSTIANNTSEKNNSIEKNKIPEEKNTTVKKEKDAEFKVSPSPQIVEKAIVKDEEKNNDGKKSLLDVAEEQQKEKEIEEVAEATYNKWSINPNVAPVYYNTIGNGSPINSQFSDNSKEGAINMSYGINIAYQLNNRLSIRSGVNKVDYGYSTKGIEFTSSTQGAVMGTVNYSARASNIKIIDNYTSNASDASQSPTSNSFNSLDVLESTSAIDVFEGSMNQQFGYLEIPLELKYRVLNKKFGVNIIGGVSSLFLTKNQITVESNSLVTEIGEANNLSNTNFSTNVGFGFDYSFTKNLQLNLEPMFKYQLNAFSNNDGGFKPYSLGIYTGLNFKF